MQTRTRFGALIAAAVMALTVGLASPAAAEEVPVVDLSAEAEAETRAFFDLYGVDPATQDALIAEFEAGGTWDAMSSDSVPIKQKKSKTDGFDQIVSWYEDGSVAVQRLEIPKKEAKPGDISVMSAPHSCTSSGYWRYGCTVDTWVGAVSLAFSASYNVNTTQVSSVWGGRWSIVGACSAKQTYLGRPAYNIGQLNVQAQMCGVGYNTVFYLRLTVYRNNPVESWG